MVLLTLPLTRRRACAQLSNHVCESDLCGEFKGNQGDAMRGSGFGTHLILPVALVFWAILVSKSEK